MNNYESQYLNLCKKILNEGEWVYNDRTGKRCKTVINHDFVYDVGNKEVPLLTTKQVFVTSAIAEIIGYIRGYTNAEDFATVGSPSWRANANENKDWLSNPNRKGHGDMGMAYRFREKGYFVEVTPAIKDTPKQEICTRKHSVVSYSTLGDNEKLIGRTFDSVTSGKYKILSYQGKSEDSRITYFNIKFIETGTELVIQKSQIRNGNIKDPFAVSVWGVGYIGTTDTKGHRKLLKVWNRMLERCYSEKHTQYHNYGGKGVFVDKRWHNFSNFKKDVEKLENYYLYKEYPKEYSLDKDFYKSNYYSKDTCKWASNKEQAINKGGVKTYQVSEGPFKKYVKGLEAVSEVLGITKNKAFKLGKEGKLSEAPADVHVSYYEDDPYKSIYCKLRNGVDDRRLIANAWLPQFEPLSCLVPCAYEHIWSLVNGKLSLTVTQRACDVPLGLPWNSVSFYWLLDTMAKITGNKPDKVYHKLVNVHVYEDQIEPLEEQLARIPLDVKPTLELPTWIESMEDLLYDDIHAREYFTLTNYEHLGKISFPFSE